MASATTDKELPSGPAAAALLSGGIGSLVIGLLTTGAVISEGLKGFLNWYSPTGALSGKTGVGIIAWLVSWLVLGTLWKDENPAIGRILTITLILIALGLLLTFPPVFEAFE